MMRTNIQSSESQINIQMVRRSAIIVVDITFMFMLSELSTSFVTYRFLSMLTSVIELYQWQELAIIVGFASNFFLFTGQ